MAPTPISPRRGHLASFENAYAGAVQIRSNSGVDQFVIATNNSIQPFRVSRHRPAGAEKLLALVA